jgi:hypothetical protein
MPKGSLSATYHVIIGLADPSLAPSRTALSAGRTLNQTPRILSERRLHKFVEQKHAAPCLGVIKLSHLSQQKSISH